jgi:pimeloyl-ACP methyl ester carboxylesterase
MARKFSRQLGVILPFVSMVAAVGQVGCLDATNAKEGDSPDGIELTRDTGVDSKNDDTLESDIDSQDPDVAVNKAALVGYTSRSDVVKNINLNQGLWGDWQTTRYCQSGSYAVGYRMRVEQGQGSGDDTALNAVELECMDAFGNISSAAAHDGLYGDWYESAYCANGTFLTGGAIRFETNRKSGDDTGGNSVSGRCSDGTNIQAPGGMSYGSWNNTVTCDAGSSVCGINVRFESGQGSGDDTALNAVQFACCTNPASTSKLRVSEHTLDGIRARTFSPDTGAHLSPLVFVEGFDIAKNINLDALNNALPYGIIGNLASLGYSVTLVDLTSNWDPIQINALRLGGLLNRLWAESTKTQPIKLIGASMGGLVVTTAAAMKTNWSELNIANPGWSFEVDHVTTVDTPHAGVYIPEAIYHVLSRFNDLNDTAGDRFDAVTSYASKQMMLIPFNDDFKTTHNTWLDYYSKVQKAIRSKGIRYVGVVDGSWNGQVQDSNWTQHYENIHWKMRSIVIDVDANLFTQSYPGALSAHINVNWLGPSVTNENKYYYSYAGPWPVVENSPGGYLNLWSDVASALGASAPSFPRISFVPTWSAAGISYIQFMSLPENQRNSMAALEAARGTIAGSSLSPFHRIFATNSNNFHATIPWSLNSAFIDEMAMARRLYNSTWTPWFDRDDPSGNGDGEHRGLMTGIPCQNPVKADCRRVRDGVDFSLTGEIVRCTTDGAECLNSQQPDGVCDDYEIRFACPPVNP